MPTFDLGIITQNNSGSTLSNDSMSSTGSQFPLYFPHLGQHTSSEHLDRLFVYEV